MRYKHTVQYYETDRMGITHHSNYVRWMEEARVAYLDSIGLSYQGFEDKGIVSPVTSIRCDYKKTSTFADEIFIDICIREFKGVKLKIEYTMSNAAEEVVCMATSTHCFLDTDGKLINIRKEYPDIYDTLANEISNL